LSKLRIFTSCAMPKNSFFFFCKAFGPKNQKSPHNFGADHEESASIHCGCWILVIGKSQISRF
jgi:hypothetical protein